MMNLCKDKKVGGRWHKVIIKVIALVLSAAFENSDCIVGVNLRMIMDQ